MKKSFIRKTAYLAAGIIFLAASLDAAASQAKKAGKSIEKLEQEQEDAKEKVGELKEEESNLKGELYDLNRQLSDASVRINDLEAQIKEKQANIDAAEGELLEAEQSRMEQYESMKLRIRFIYESGGVDIAGVLLSSNSFADLLNKVEYVEAISRYDRQMLYNYEAVCNQISEKKQNLQAEEGELLAMQESMKQKQDEVKALIAKTQGSLLAKQDEIAEATEKVNGYKAQIAKMKAYEEELERKKAEEARKKAEEQKKKEESEGSQKPDTQDTSPGGSVSAGAGDLAMLAAIVECEAGGESYEGQWAVASVVINRMRSSSFPNTISGVIYQSGQFSPVASGRFAVVLARGAAESCVRAASAALLGSTNVSALYFCMASSGVAGTVIGKQVFY